MPDPATPTETARRRAVDRLLGALVLAAMLFHLGRRLGRVLAPPPPFVAPPPLAVDVATDPAHRLALLPGVGPVRAAAIVEDRRRHGAPSRLADLGRVRGIGPDTIRTIRAAEQVRVLVGGRPVAGAQPGCE